MRVRRTNYSLFLLGLLILGILTGQAIPPAESQGTTTVQIWSNDYVSSDIIDQSLTTGSRFVLDMLATDLPPIVDTSTGGINGFDITVTYDSSVLKAIDASHTAPLCPAIEGCLFDSSNALQVQRSLDDPPGTTRLVVVLLPGRVEGSGTLFRIVFEVTGRGFTNIEISNPNTDGGSQLVVGATRVSFNPVDGRFENRLPFRLDSDALAVSVFPGESISVNIFANQVWTITNFTETIRFEASGLPQNAQTLFDPVSGILNFSTKLTVNTDPNTSSGDYTVRITGISDFSNSRGVSTSFTLTVNPVHSVNVIANPSFENGLDLAGLPIGWGNWTKHGPPDSTITIDNARATSGVYSARLDIGQTPIGFIALYQNLPANTFFRNLTDRPDGLDLWFYLEPKYAGLGDARVRVLFGENVGEINYVFDADPVLSYPNQTATTPYGMGGVKSILLQGYSAGQWHHLQRNLRADWAAPLKLPNGSFAPGFSLDVPLFRIQFDILAFQILGSYYAETAWIDDFKVYLNVGGPPQPDTSPPTWPPGSMLTASSIGTTSLVLSWTAATDNIGVTRYRVFIRNPPNLLATLGGTTYSYTAIGLTPGATYEFRVQAGDAAENWSTDGPFVTLTMPLPPSGGLPEVSVWSQACRSSTIEISNPACGSLSVGTQITIDVNVTNAPEFNAYEFYLYHDPSFLQAYSIDVGINTMFGNPFVVVNDMAPPGTVHLAVVNLGSASPGGNGILAHITFRIVGSGVSPLTLAAGMKGFGTFSTSGTILTLGSNPIDIATMDGYFRNQLVRVGPRAEFAFSPLPAFQGTPIRFDATGSLDPDNPAGIRFYAWDFGDGVGATNTTSPTVTHFFGSLSGTAYVGNFSVRLIVVDKDDGFIGIKTMRVEIIPVVVHDVAVLSVMAVPTPVSLGDPVSITVLVKNNGGYDETFSLTLTYSPPITVIAQRNGGTIRSGESLSFKFILDTTGLATTDYVISASGTIPADDVLSNNSVATHITVRVPNIPPVARFTVSPDQVIVGQSAFFDGSDSFDPDGFIVSYQWNFGDGSNGISEPVNYHSYSLPGNYTVVLEVTDNRGASAVATSLVNVRPRPVHDIAIDRIEISPRTVVSGQLLTIQIVLRNKGLSTESVDLTVYYDLTVIETRRGISLEPDLYAQYVAILWDTSGIPPGNYTLSATASLPADELPDDNSFTDEQVRVLPPPVLTISPTSGELDTKVTIEGSGFPIPLNGPGFSLVIVSFDDAFLGITIGSEGHFRFTFNVQHAEPGPHVVKTLDLFSGTQAKTTFEVLPPPTPARPLSIILELGAVYFPGDTADMYLVVSQDGSAVGPSDVQLQLTLIRSDKSNTTLTPQFIGPGLYKASYAIPRAGPTGTYALVARARLSDSNATALRAFEVKPSWISNRSTRIVSTALGISGIIAVITIAWRSGYFSRRKENALEVFTSSQSCFDLWTHNMITESPIV